MARFERGKGKKKTGWDICQFGEVLRAHDQPATNDYLPGYRRFRNAAQAYGELQRLMAERLKQGFEPADDQARQLAADLPIAERPQDQPPQLPLRCDISVYNEATGFCITSGKMAGKGIESGEAKWDKAVLDGKIIPIGLIQDDPFIIRVVAGETLSEQEMEEWVGRIDWHLDLSDGQLVICGGAEYLMDDYEEGDSYADQFVAKLPVPPGRYRATVYFQLHGVNGKACLDELAGGYDRMEAAGLWFRRTRANTPFPAWLHHWCIGSPDDDPGHEAEWQNLPYPEHGPDYVDFLLHLQPDTTPAETKKSLGKPATEGGWFSETAGARKPERCPLGLEAYNLLARKEPAAAAGGWIYLHDMPGTVTPKLFPLKEDLVLPLESIADVFTLAWFAHTHTRPELRVTLPSSQTFDTGCTWPEQVMAWQEGDILRIGFGNDLYGQAVIDTLAALAPLLAALPTGSVLELFCSQVQYEGDDPKAGLQRYRGNVTEQSWQIDAVYPAVKPAQINAALELARECRNGTSLRVQDEAEAKSILAWLRANYGPYAIEDNPPRYADNALRLKKPEVGLLRLLASAAFAVRYRKIWPVMNRGDDGQDDKESTAASQEIAMPIKGAKILEPPSGRIYMQTLALMLSEALAERIQKEEKALRKLGFSHVADIVCSQFDHLAIRGYADAGNDTWATFLIASPDTLVLEFSTRFEQSQASLLTTQQANQTDDAASHTFRQSLPAATFEEMYTAHKQRKEALTADYGSPLSFARGIKSLAEAVEAALVKQ